MSLNYLDASAWVKRYFEEPGSEALDRMFEEGTVASSSFGYVEVAGAVARQRARGKQVEGQRIDGLEEKLDRDWNRMLQLEVTKEVMEGAVGLARRYRLRGADAVHLSVVVHLQRQLDADLAGDLRFVTFDEELIAAGQATGVTVDALR